MNLCSFIQLDSLRDLTMALPKQTILVGWIDRRGEVGFQGWNVYSMGNRIMQPFRKTAIFIIIRSSGGINPEN